MLLCQNTCEELDKAPSVPGDFHGNGQFPEERYVKSVAGHGGRNRER